MNPRTRILVALLATLALGAVLAACGGGEDTTAAQPETTAIAPRGDATATPETEPGPSPEPEAQAPSEPAVTTIEVRGGEPVGGVQELEYSAGEEIRFKVSSDAAEEIHVHGYDVAKDVPAGGTVEFAFPAEIEGIFEIELEQLGVQIAELQVNP